MKRWLLRISLCLILGAITTVAVAWGCASLSPRPTGRKSYEGIDLFSDIGQSRYRETLPDGSPGEFVVFRFDGFGVVEWHDGEPSGFLNAGLPVHSLTGSIAGGRIRQTTAPPMGKRPFELPFRPIWPGFLIDALFYAFVWFGVLFGFTTARRAMRRRRGRCPMCGYDLRGDLVAGCSECGWNRGKEVEP